jgi:hypothetical protein
MKTTELLPTSQIPTREQQLRDITTTGTGDASECSSSATFKEFRGKEGK